MVHIARVFDEEDFPDSRAEITRWMTQYGDKPKEDPRHKPMMPSFHDGTRSTVRPPPPDRRSTVRPPPVDRRSTIRPAPQEVPPEEEKKEEVPEGREPIGDFDPPPQRGLERPNLSNPLTLAPFAAAAYEASEEDRERFMAEYTTPGKYFQYDAKDSTAELAVFKAGPDAVVIGIRGSSTINDWTGTDVDLLLGGLKDTARYKNNLAKVKEIQEKLNLRPDQVYLSGHSLGGSIALQMSHDEGYNASGFNAAVSPVSLIAGDKYADNAHNFVVGGDPVSNTSYALGESLNTTTIPRTFYPSKLSNELDIGAIHSMKNFLIPLEGHTEESGGRGLYGGRQLPTETRSEPKRDPQDPDSYISASDPFQNAREDNRKMRQAVWSRIGDPIVSFGRRTLDHAKEDAAAALGLPSERELRREWADLKRGFSSLLGF